MDGDPSLPTADPRVTVHIVRGRSARRALAMQGDELVIGASPDCDLQMRSSEVALRHCVLERSNGQTRVRKLDASGPLRVNGSDADEARLCDGDRLSIGPFELSISIEPPGNPPADAAPPTLGEPGGGMKSVARESELEERRAAVAKDSAQLVRVRRRLFAVLHRRIDQLEQTRQDLERDRTELESRIAEFQRIGSERLNDAAAAIEATAECAELSAMTSERLSAIAEREAHLAQRQTELEQERQRIETQHGELERELTRLRHTAAELDSRCDAAESESRRLQLAGEELTRDRHSLEQHELRLAEEALQRREELQRWEHELRRQQALLENRQAAQKAQVRRLRELASRFARRHLRTSEPSIEPSVLTPESDQADQVRRHELVDRALLEAAIQSARRRGSTLETELLAMGLLTEHQLRLLRAGAADGFRIGQAVVLDVLHAGQVADTLLVREPSSSDPVVLRLVHARFCRDPESWTQHETTIRALREFRHTHLSQVLGLVRHDGRIGILSEFAPGVSLNGLPPVAVEARTLALWFRQGLSVLAAAQQRGFVHRGLRPSRIRIGDDANLKLVGYGCPAWLARIDGCEGIGRADRYAAPEVMSAGPPIDVRADVFSLARSFLELAGVSAIERFESLLLRLCDPGPQRRCRRITQVVAEVDEILRETGQGSDPSNESRHLLSRAGDEPEPPSLAA